MQAKGHHEIRTADHDIKGGSDRSFGLVIAGALTVFGALNCWHFGRVWPFYLFVAAMLLLAAWIVPTWLAPFNRIWTKLGFLLAKIVNPIIMGVVFFVVITPFALLARLRGADLLKLRMDPSALSYWIKRDQSVQTSMKDQF